MLDILGVVRETYEIPTRALCDDYYEKVGNRNLSPEQEAELEKLAEQKFVERGEMILAYVKEHANDLYMPVFIEDQLSEYDYDWGKRGYDLLSPEMQASQPGRLLKEKVITCHIPSREDVSVVLCTGCWWKNGRAEIWGWEGVRD
ncbi:MAG: hypothetical protein V8R91_11910 [Butyricimonas faecihominis]